MRKQTIRPSQDIGRRPQATISRSPLSPPRCRMTGGDIPRGGIPGATGHAGRRLRSIVVLLGSLIQLVFGLCMGCTQQAYAATEVHFVNGGHAQLEDDGTITGTASIGEWTDEWGEIYPVTLPDGTTTTGHCIDHLHFAPAAGSYSLEATPNGNGTFSVVVRSDMGSSNVRQPDALVPLLSPPQRIGQITWKPKLMGKLKLEKTSSLPLVSDNNQSYSLADAIYGIWKDAECTQSVDIGTGLRTNSNGITNEVELTPGTYWVKEIEAPRGYKLDEQAHRVEVPAGQTATVPVRDVPLYETPTLWANKYDIDVSHAQGAATLENAEFTVRYFDGVYSLDNLPEQAARTWVLRTTADGRLVPSESYLVSGGEFYRGAQGNVILPIGTVAIQETKAPLGYYLEGQDESSPNDYQAPVHVCVVDGSGSFDSPQIGDAVRRAGISLIKHDAQTGQVSQGDATLSGIAFSIISRNTQEVTVDGVTYRQGDVVWTMRTTADGTAATAKDLLPVGTYEVVETSTNESMLNTSSSQTITLNEGSTNTVMPLGTPMKNSVVRGGVAVGKVSSETGQHVGQGEASLAGAVFSITLASRQNVVVGTKSYAPNSEVCSITTNASGIATTGAHDLPYGTYVIREKQAPKGYLLDKSWSRTISIRKDGVIEDLTAPGNSASNQVMRGGFSFNKADGETMARMASVPWRITSNSTQESHVIVADENGIVDTEASAHSANTNANDSAWKSGQVDEAALDSAAGIWFDGSPDIATTPNDDLGALPYDTYTVEELPSTANEGHRLVSFVVRIHRDGIHLDMGTVDNMPTANPSIGTTLSYAGSEKIIPENETITLIDTVTYEGLEVGAQYELQGTLLLKETGKPLSDADNNPVQGSTTFTPSSSSGTERVAFTLSTKDLAGNTLVASEILMQGDKEIVRHEDIDDTEQTVYVPRIGTRLTDQDGNHDVAVGEDVSLVDEVSYENLVAHLRYDLVGTLIDKATGEPLRDSSGNEVRATTSFVPEDACGSETVTFSFDTRCAEGKTLVAYETLMHAAAPIARHENLDDEGQTVFVPQIRTTLLNKEKSHVANAQATVELTDTVTFSNLLVGKEYELQGVLMDKETNEKILDEKGNEITAQATFTPASDSGTQDVIFTVDGALLAGKAVVAFEELRSEERTLCVHASIEDEEQTVYLPLIHTTLTGEGGVHEAFAGRITLTDTIDYQGLKPQESYTLEGTLVDKQTGEAISDANGNTCVAHTTFTPKDSVGTIPVTFDLDAISLAGHSLVAFEVLYEGEGVEGRELARHADTEDANQTVAIPSLATSARVGDTEERVIDSTGAARVIDTVSYQGLTPGVTYTMLGTLHKKDTGDEVGKEVAGRASIDFVPTASDGNVEVSFDLDTSKIGDGGIVVFETCLREGREVASHKDINAESQTILIRREQKKETPQEESRKQLAKQAAPRTGDATTWLLPLSLGLLGGSILVARKLL